MGDEAAVAAAHQLRECSVCGGKVLPRKRTCRFCLCTEKAGSGFQADQRFDARALLCDTRASVRATVLRAWSVASLP